MNTDEVIEFEDQELWRDAPGFGKYYEVSSFGRLRRKGHWKKYRDGQKHYYPAMLLKTLIPSGNGYIVKTLTDDYNNPQQVAVHRLVAQAFIPNPDNKPCINHLDTNRTNNHISNLEWCTQQENAIHSIHFYKKQGAIQLKPVRCSETGEVFESAADAARYVKKVCDNITNTKATSGNIWAAAKKMRPTAGGFHWEFVEVEYE